MKFAQLWVPLFLHYIEERHYKLAWKSKKRIFCVIWKVLFWECTEKVRKSIDFVGFLGGFGVFLLCCGYWNRYGIEKYCKSWKEKVFVLRDYIYTYMFRLCSEKFRAAAIEKNCILFELYQNNRTKTGSRKEDRKENMFVFIIENTFGLNVKKLYNITFNV